MKYTLILLLSLFTYAAHSQLKDTIKFITPGVIKDTFLTITTKTPVQKTITYTDTIRTVQTVYKPFVVVTTPPIPPPSTINIALNRTVTTSSNETTLLTGNFAVDGNLTTRWSSIFAVDPQWATIDLGSGYNIQRVNIVWENAFASDYSIQTSVDNVSWTVIKTITGNTALTNNHNDLIGKGRYVRINGTKRATPYGYSIYEVEVFGSSDGSIPVNQSPAVNAGVDQSIHLPINTVTLSGNATDNDGTISSYLWTKVSGGNAVITTSTAKQTTVTGLVQGTYVFKLEATDNKGAKASGNVTIVVNAAPPTGSIKYFSLPVGTPQVYNNRTNLVIENLRFTNPSGDILTFSNCSNITVRNCYFGASSGEAIAINFGSNITIEKCLFANNRTGVYIVQTTGNIKVINNQFVNAKGPMPRGQYVQYNTCTGPGNLVEGNRGESFLGRSDPADLINIFSSQGTATSPVTVRNNILRGGGPLNSGGGIMAGDIGGRFALVEDNVLFDPGQYGIGIAGGSDITIRNNKVYANQYYFNNIGFYAWAQAGATCGANIIFTNNRSHYTKADGSMNNWWAAPNCSVSGNIPTDITVAEMNFPVHLIDFITPAELNTIK